MVRTESGDYKIHTFTGDGNFIVSSCIWYISSTKYRGLSCNCWWWWRRRCLIGGAGAGGYRESKASASPTHTASPHFSPVAASTGITLTAQTYPITVGGGAWYSCSRKWSWF